MESRIPFISLDSGPYESVEIMKETLKKYGVTSNFFGAMGHSSPAIKAWLTADAGIRRTRIENGDLQFLKFAQMVIIKVSSINGASGEYCLNHNTHLAKEIGLTSDVIEEVKRIDYHDSNLLNHEEKVVVRWAEAVTKLEAYDDHSAFENMKSYFNTKDIVELTVLACMWNWSNRFCGAMHVPHDTGNTITFYPKKD